MNLGIMTNRSHTSLTSSVFCFYALLDGKRFSLMRAILWLLSKTIVYAKPTSLGISTVYSTMLCWSVKITFIPLSRMGFNQSKLFLFWRRWLFIEMSWFFILLTYHPCRRSTHVYSKWITDDQGSLTSNNTFKQLVYVWLIRGFSCYVSYTPGLIVLLPKSIAVCFLMGTQVQSHYTRFSHNYWSHHLCIKTNQFFIHCIGPSLWSSNLSQCIKTRTHFEFV